MTDMWWTQTKSGSTPRRNAFTFLTSTATAMPIDRYARGKITLSMLFLGCRPRHDPEHQGSSGDGASYDGQDEKDDSAQVGGLKRQLRQ